MYCFPLDLSTMVKYIDAVVVQSMGADSILRHSMLIGVTLTALTSVRWIAMGHEVSKGTVQ